MLKEKPRRAVARLTGASPDCTLGLLVRAQSPATTADVLRHLADCEESRIRQAVAKNPKTPVDVVLRLAEDAPDSFLKNPAVGLLVWEDPAFLQCLSKKALRSVLSAEKTPPDWLRWAASHEDAQMRRLAAAHSNAPLDALEGLAGDADPAVRAAAASNDELPERSAASLFGDPHPKVRAQVAVRPALPPSLLKCLARDPDSRVRERVAENPGAPSEALMLLAGDAAPCVRAAVGARPEISRDASRDSPINSS
jgi:hypothetical protein